MKITLARSQACGEPHGLGEATTSIPLDTSDGPWVQFTYGTLRSQDGEWLDLVWRDDLWWHADEPWSDLIVEEG